MNMMVHMFDMYYHSKFVGNISSSTSTSLYVWNDFTSWINDYEYSKVSSVDYVCASLRDSI